MEAKEERGRNRGGGYGGIVFTLYRHSGLQPFDPPPLYSFELLRGFGSFFMAVI